MNFLNYSLTTLVCYIGLFAGFFLAVIAKEELKAGKKYFIFLQKIVLMLVFVFLLVFIKLGYVLVLLILGFIIVLVMKDYFKIEFNEVFYLYIILSVVFYLSSKIFNLLVIESSLIFLYGFPTGSLLVYKNKKKALIEIVKNVIFVVVAMILFLFF